MSEDFHKLEKQESALEKYVWPHIFQIFFFGVLIFLILFFVLAYFLSDPVYLVEFNIPEFDKLLKSLLILIPMFIGVLIILPFVLKKFLTKKNNTALYLLGIVFFMNLAMIMGVVSEFFKFGSGMLTTFSYQAIFIVILAAMYCYFMFDQEIFHQGYKKMSRKTLIISLLCFIIPSFAIFERVLKLNLYPNLIMSIFLGLPTAILVFYTQYDIISQSIKILKILNGTDKKFDTAYKFIAMSSIILITFFMIFTAIIVFELPQDSLLFYGNLTLLTIIMIFLYLGYIWPMRMEKKTKK